MMSLSELAERCERAAENDQDGLLQEAWNVLFPKPAIGDEPQWGGATGTLREPLFHHWKVRQLTFQALLSAKGFLDAAMTLVPEGYDWIIGRTNGGLTIHAEVGGRGDEFMRFGNTPALALCSAALRARAASADTHPKDGDVKQAPLVSGAVPSEASADAQTQSGQSDE